MRILNSDLSAVDRKTLYPLDFDINEVLMIDRFEKGRPALITKNGKEFYQVVCENIQLHGEKETLCHKWT